MSEELRKRVAELEKQIDQFWDGLWNRWEIESREEIEKDTKESWAKGTSPLNVALHYIWKREPKVAELKEKIDRLTGRGIEDMKHEIAELKAQLAEAYKCIDEEGYAVGKLTAQLAEHEWVSVEDRLPDFEVEVLALCDENEDAMVRQLDYNGRWRNCHGADYDYTVTHWKPITLPAQGKEQAVDHIVDADKKVCEIRAGGTYFCSGCLKMVASRHNCGLEIKEICK